MQSRLRVLWGLLGTAAIVAALASPSGAAPVTAEPAAAASGWMPDGALATATNFRVTELTETTVGVAWDADSRSRVVVRRTPGSVPAASVTDGVRVPVSGNTARGTRLAPGSAHTLSLFTRVGGVWQGPVALSVGTIAPAGSESATFVSTTTARFLSESQIVSAVVDETGVWVRQAAGLPAVGTVLGLPITADLPEGYLGTVSSVEPDGLVRLTPAGFSEAFDYWKVDVDAFATDPTTGPALAAAAAAKPTCTGAGNPEIDFGDPIPTLKGSFHGEFVSKEINYLPFPVLVGARLRGDATTTIDINGNVKADGAATCTIELQKVARPLRVGPLPLTMTVQPRIEVTIDSQIDIKNLGFSASAKASFDTEFTVDGGPSKAEGAFEADFQPQAPTGAGEGSMSLALVSDAKVGWGEAAGLQLQSELPNGKITVTKQPDNVTDPYCVVADLGAKFKSDVYASLWLVGAKSYPLFEKTIAALPGSPWSWPQSCGGGSPTAILLLGYSANSPIHTFIRDTLIDDGFDVVAIEGYNLLNLERDRFKQVWDFTSPGPAGHMVSTYLRGGANGNAPGVISFCSDCGTDYYYVDGGQANWDGPPYCEYSPEYQCASLSTRFGDVTIGNGRLLQMLNVPVDDTLAFRDGRAIGFVKEEPVWGAPERVWYRLVTVPNSWTFGNDYDTQAFIRDNGNFVSEVAQYLAQGAT